MRMDQEATMSAVLEKTEQQMMWKSTISFTQYKNVISIYPQNGMLHIWRFRKETHKSEKRICKLLSICWTQNKYIAKTMQEPKNRFLRIFCGRRCVTALGHTVYGCYRKGWQIKAAS